jgi:hypothetical protein
MMPKPKTKAIIIERLHTERRRLENNLASFSQEELLVPGVVGEWSAKDVMAHLAEWESYMPVWIEAARQGKPVETPAPGLTWKQLDILNQRIYEAHRHQSLEEVLEYFHAAHSQFMAMVEAMPEEEMLTYGLYTFTGGLVYNWLNAYALHDLWAKDVIRSWLKTRKG